MYKPQSVHCYSQLILEWRSNVREQVPNWALGSTAYPTAYLDDTQLHGVAAMD